MKSEIPIPPLNHQPEFAARTFGRSPQVFGGDEAAPTFPEEIVRVLMAAGATLSQEWKALRKSLELR